MTSLPKVAPKSFKFRPGRWAFNVLVVLAYIFLIAAPVVVIYYSFSPGVVLKMPPDGLTLRWYENILTQPRLMSSVWTSVIIATAATFGALALGIPASYALVRSNMPGRELLASFFLSPLNIPGLVLAIGLLMFLVGAIQPIFGFTMVGTLAPLLAGHVIVSVPWVIRTVSASLETMDTAPEEAARGLGAGQLSTFFLVTLPMIFPGVLAGAIFSFIVSFSNFAISLFFASSGVNTLPVAIFQYIDQFQDPTVAAISSVVIVLTTIVVITADRFGGITRVGSPRRGQEKLG